MSQSEEMQYQCSLSDLKEENERLKQQNAELLEALKTLKSKIDYAKSEYNACYAIETEDYKMIESLINKYTQS